jgi:hypothetical protein
VGSRSSSTGDARRRPVLIKLEKYQPERRLRILFPSFAVYIWVELPRVDPTPVRRLHRSIPGDIRWEKKKRNYLARIHFACKWITYQQAGIFG